MGFFGHGGAMNEAHGLGCHRHSQDASSIDMGVDLSCSDLGD